jgi:RNA polymerase sigma factor (sigma-70 family)
MRPFVLHRARRTIPSWLQAKFDPEDLAQEVLLEFYRGIVSLAGHEERQIRGWLGRATVNRGRDLLRRYGVGGKRDITRETSLLCPQQCLPHFVAGSEGPAQQVIFAELCEIIQAEISQLPDDQRRALELYLDGKHSYADVARSLGRSSEAARKLCGRARSQLQRQLRARQIST